MAKVMTFEYSGAPQRSPEWFRLRLGKVTSSRLCDWLAVSKAAATKGKPLKPRLDYEKELMFERQFGTSFEKFVSAAMNDGVDYEDFARRQYEQITGNRCDEVGCWYNDYFVASPDRAVTEAVGDIRDESGEPTETSDGLLEIKVLKDNSFTELLTEGVSEKHWMQIQGQLWASGRQWCDYVAINLNTKKVKIIRVLPDREFHQWIELTLGEKLVTAEFSGDQLYDFVDALPETTAVYSEATNTRGDDWA